MAQCILAIPFVYIQIDKIVHSKNGKDRKEKRKYKLDQGVVTIRPNMTVKELADAMERDVGKHQLVKTPTLMVSKFCIIKQNKL